MAVKHGSEAMKVTGETKKEGGGSIILTASVAGIRSGAGPIDYSASKAAFVPPLSLLHISLTREIKSDQPCGYGMSDARGDEHPCECDLPRIDSEWDDYLYVREGRGEGYAG
jgi:hypothetical protein